MAKTRYMIVSGATVTVVRDGVRKPISPGGGTDFTEEEITSITNAIPGALRKPINEGRGKSSGDDTDTDVTEKPKAEKGAKITHEETPKQKKAREAAEAKAAKADVGNATDDDDEDI